MTTSDKFSWLTEGPVDFELKQYKMMAVLSRLKKELSYYNIWPVIEEVESQLDNLYRTKYEIEICDEKLKVAKDIDFINFEIIYEKESSEHTIQNEIMDAIVDEGIVEFGDLYMDAREAWRDIEKHISLTWIPKRPPLLNDGYVLVPNGELMYAYYFEKPTKMSNSWRKLNLELHATFDNTQDEILKFYDSAQNDKETLMFARTSITFGGVPHQTAVVPVVKSVLFNALVKDFA